MARLELAELVYGRDSAAYRRFAAGPQDHASVQDLRLDLALRHWDEGIMSDPDDPNALGDVHSDICSIRLAFASMAPGLFHARFRKPGPRIYLGSAHQAPPADGFEIPAIDHFPRIYVPCMQPASLTLPDGRPPRDPLAAAWLAGRSGDGLYVAVLADGSRAFRVAGNVVREKPFSRPWKLVGRVQT